MKIAVLISGLARFPEQGFAFLERIIEQSEHDIDVFAGVWSIDEIPQSVSSKVKRIETISYNLRNDVYFLLERHHLTNKQISLSMIADNHAGLISHMATCSAFKDELMDYDLVVKWRWDVAVQPNDFDIILKDHNRRKDRFITDDINVQYGCVVMNEVVFAATPELMIKAFAPLEERFLVLGRMIQQDAINFGAELQVSVLSSFAKLIINCGGSIVSTPFRWALLRKNILDHPDYVNCCDPGLLIKLQREADLQRDKIKHIK